VPNDNFNNEFDSFTRGLIRRKIEQLIGKAGFTAQDRQDLEQQFRVRVLQALRSFDPAVAPERVFLTAVIDRQGANLLRDRQAAKRYQRRVVSLNVTIHVEGEGLTELAQTIGRRELDARLGRDTRSEQDLLDRVLDVAAVIESLPAPLRELAKRRKSQTMQEISDALGIPRTTLNERMREIRQVFERAGLKEYL
jgi:RNA polymerase sigma-70 factor (ECF subfamily)